MIRPEDSPAVRKERGAFFTPPQIADYLADWAVGGDRDARILDPTCGEAAFLRSAGLRLRALGQEDGDLEEHLFGVDLHEASLDRASTVLETEGLSAHLLAADFFDIAPPGATPEIATPEHLGAPLPVMDAVIGNPPFVRYQRHIGEARAKSRQAALRQHVRLSGLASSWAALLVHAGGFLQPDGRLAMVLPAELLTVGYADPIRAWLRRRFEQVHLVLFERLQFPDATEKVVLVLASGSGGCDAFSLYCLHDAADLVSIRPMTNLSVTPSDSGKWTDLLLPNRQRRLFKAVSSERFTPLSSYGKPELGTVTGANHYFTMSEQTRVRYRLIEGRHVMKVCPPGTKHLRSLDFSTERWTELRAQGERVWLLYPAANDRSRALAAYLARGREQAVHEAYKCTIRSPWWRPPAVPPPDLFFTYMSHRYPRLIANTAEATFVNSMHGVRLLPGAPRIARSALPLVSLNSVSLLGAEVFGRSYGGGILKMEPREAALLPVPAPDDLQRAWERLESSSRLLDEWLAAGRWTEVVTQVDDVLLRDVMGVEPHHVKQLLAAADALRSRRLTRSEPAPAAE
ncbi:MAG: SAM-dependent DNA methyltransferase [Pseudonocardiales bacterium]|nr:SAM-dependent DNA methyltransferase [Pseudonocardiales bacterium]